MARVDLLHTHPIPSAPAATIQVSRYVYLWSFRDEVFKHVLTLEVLGVYSERSNLIHQSQFHASQRRLAWSGRVMVLATGGSRAGHGKA